MTEEKPPPKPPPPAWAIPPALCEPLQPIELLDKRIADHSHPVWSGEVIETEGHEPGRVYRCVFKLVDEPKRPVELACALAGQVLNNDVPQPCLVRADPATLPGVPHEHAGKPALLLFGCAYVDQDAFFEQLAADGPGSTLERAVWNSFCAGDHAARGAALDELIANIDRHYLNLRYDGKRWWLIDHELSLAESHGQDVSTMPADFTAGRNQIAAELVTRRHADHGMPDAARLSSQRLQALQALAAVAQQWHHRDAQIAAVWRDTAALLGLLARRLPMLQQLIAARIGANTHPPALQWPPSPP